MTWSQGYDPFGSPILSTLVAALPIIVMLSGLAFLHMRAHIAALAGLITAFLVAIICFHMPLMLASKATLFGAATGLMPIGWIVLNIIFLYQLTNQRGQFDILRNSIAGVTEDSRLQLLLIAFCFGAFFEGAAGFGAPVAVTGAMLIGLGFTRLQASGLSLIANTAPVAFGALGTPILTLQGITNLPLLDLSAMVGREMFLFSLIVPFWLLVAYCGFKRSLEVWPATLTAGLTFALLQLLISNLHGPWLTAICSSVGSIIALVVLLRVWQPKRIMHVNEAPLAKGDERVPIATSDSPQEADEAVILSADEPTRGAVVRAWMPWLILTVTVFIWGMPQVRSLLDGLFGPNLHVPGLDDVVFRVPPVVASPAPEAAVYKFNLLSMTGTAILVAAIMSGLVLGAGPGELIRTYARTLRSVSASLLTIAAMLALGYLTRFAGIDATMGLAFAATGFLYPYFGTMLGWLGVAVTGSDTASNVLFGGLQTTTSHQLGLSPVLMAGANSAGGVMGKMIDTQSIVVASTATQWFGQEGRILRYVFVHSIALASLVGLVVMLMAYVKPFTALVIH